MIPLLPLSPAKPGPRLFCFVPFFVYMLASQRNGTLYLGYADDIFRRVTAPKAHSLGGFTGKYDAGRRRGAAQSVTFRPQTDERA